jgi:hypothetical protein
VQNPCFTHRPVQRVGLTARIVEDGFPHSEIHGSKVVRTSPRLNAAYHVLHRLSMPRHPLNALKALDRFHYRCASGSRRRVDKEGKDQLASFPPGTIRGQHSVHGVANTHHDWACEAGRNSLTMSNSRQASWRTTTIVKTRTLVSLG